MAIAWQDRFTPLANVNSGNELENGDTATGEHITIALENGAYAKKKTDENASDISSLQGSVSSITTKLTIVTGTFFVAQLLQMNDRGNYIFFNGYITSSGNTYAAFVTKAGVYYIVNNQLTRAGGTVEVAISYIAL